VVRMPGSVRWPHPRGEVLGLLLEWVPGPPLHLWAETENPSFRRLGRVGCEVARTLGELHARGLLHRDLKPEHILIREPDGAPMLLDFGVGWYEGASTLTSTPIPPGTLHLRSPESLCFNQVHYGKHSGTRYRGTRADDLYALGVCLYRAVTGHYPFPPGEPADFLQMRIMHGGRYAPADYNRRMPGALGEVIERLLAKQPEARYPSGEAVAEALEAAMASGEAEAWEASLFEWEDEGRRLIRRPERPRPPQEPERPPEPQAAPEAPARVENARGGWSTRRLGVVAALGLGLCVVGVRSWLHREPPLREPHPAVVAPPMSPEDSSMNPLPPSEAREPSAPRGRSTLLPLLCLSAACASSPQARPGPPPQECPPGAIEVMTERFELPLGPWGPSELVVFDRGDTRRIPVSEGYAALEFETAWYGVPKRTILNGRLLFGAERVHGRFTEARLPDGELVPVCFETWEEGRRGSEIMERTSEPDTVLIMSVVAVKGVERFE
jgi:eukaryotic-like serine/threonine-protein kinase